MHVANRRRQKFQEKYMQPTAGAENFKINTCSPPPSAANKCQKAALRAAKAAFGGQKSQKAALQAAKAAFGGQKYQKAALRASVFIGR